MFIQQSQTPHINNTGNVYRNIGNVFKNHITVIEKNYILNYCPALLITYLYIYSNNYIFSYTCISVYRTYLLCYFYVCLHYACTFFCTGSSCHQVQFLVCVNILGNKALLNLILILYYIILVNYIWDHVTNSVCKGYFGNT